MNNSHSSLTDWGLTHVRIEQDFSILDVGCGGGRTMQKLAALAPEGKIFGVDYSASSVSVARGKNAQLIKAGRVEVQRASVSQLPFPENKFDLVTAVETQYYWPDLVNDMQEILRVLKPGGVLIVIAESYKGAKFDIVQRPVMKLLRSTIMSLTEQQELFVKAGYADVRTYEEPKKGWMCATGRKSVISERPS